MNVGKSLVLGSAMLASAGCSDFDYPPYPAYDAGAYDARTTICKNKPSRGYSYYGGPGEGESIPPDSWVKEAIFEVLENLKLVFEAAGLPDVFSKADVEKIRVDLKNRLLKSGFEILEDIDEAAELEKNPACLDADLAGVALAVTPVEGERGKINGKILFTLKVKAPDGTEGKAGLAAECSSIVSETGDKALACVLYGVFVADEGCGEIHQIDLGAPASVAVWNRDRTAGLRVDSFAANVGTRTWETDSDGKTKIGNGIYTIETDVCHGNKYLAEAEAARSGIAGYAE